MPTRCIDRSMHKKTPLHVKTTHSSTSKLHAPLEVAKGHHVGYIEAKINLNWSKPQNPV